MAPNRVSTAGANIDVPTNPDIAVQKRATAR